MPVIEILKELIDSLQHRLLTSPVFLALNTLAVVSLLGILLYTEYTWSALGMDVTAPLQAIPLPTGLVVQQVIASLSLLLLPLILILIGCLVLYPVVSVQALINFVGRYFSASENVQADSTRPYIQLADLLEKSVVLTLLNLLALGGVLWWLKSEIANVSLDGHIAVVAGILSMVGIGIFLIPFVLPIGWTMICALILFFLWQTILGLYRPFRAFIPTETFVSFTNVIKADNDLYGLSKNLPKLSWSHVGYLALVFLGIFAISIITESVIQAESPQNALFSLIVILVPLGVYLSGRVFLNKYRRWVALLLIVISIPIWFVLATVVLGILSEIFW